VRDGAQRAAKTVEIGRKCGTDTLDVPIILGEETGD
jgi:hypothetical protein